MAHIIITTTPEEHAIVLAAVKKTQGPTIAVSAISKVAGMNQNRVRYVLADLIEAGKVVRIPAKQFNKHYVRYRYEAVE